MANVKPTQVDPSSRRLGASIPGMKFHRSALAGFLAALALFTLGTLPNAARGERTPPSKGAMLQFEGSLDARVIVKYKADNTLTRTLSVRNEPDVRPLRAATLSERLRIPLTDGRVLGQRMQSLRGTGLSSFKLAEQLAALPEVEWAVPDQRRRFNALPNDPLFVDNQATSTPAAGQWYLRSPTTLFVSAINAIAAWNLTNGSPSITVAVLDTGVLSAHPDLAGKLQPNGMGGYGYNFINDIATANNGIGRTASSEDPGDGTTLGECGFGEAGENSSWHGTQVAGLIGAATDNGIGMASVGRNVMVLPVRVLGRCGGYDSDVIAAMRWAAGITSEVGVGASVTLVNIHPARVINLSLGSTGACPNSYRDTVAEVTAAGVIVVAAAGNENGLAVDAPANCPGVIAVAGLRHVGTKVGYSNIGPQVSIAAPAGNCGNSIACLYPLITTSNTGTTAPITSPADYVYTGGGSNASFGTSFSAPLVSGTVGLMLSANPELRHVGVKSLLQSTARAFPTSGGEVTATICRAPDGTSQIECYCTTATCGAGMLNTAGAVAHAFDPTAQVTSSNATPTAGAVVVLDGSSSVAYGGRTITSYQWTVLSGGLSASFLGAANTASVPLTTVTGGSVTVQLVVTDSSGATASSTTSLTVTPGAIVGSPGGSSGGGAIDWNWLLGMTAAFAWLLATRFYASARKRRVG